MLIQPCQTQVIKMVSCGSVWRSTSMASIMRVSPCVCLLRQGGCVLCRWYGIPV